MFSASPSKACSSDSSNSTSGSLLPSPSPSVQKFRIKFSTLNSRCVSKVLACICSWTSCGTPSSSQVARPPGADVDAVASSSAALVSSPVCSDNRDSSKSIRNCWMALEVMVLACSSAKKKEIGRQVTVCQSFIGWDNCPSPFRPPRSPSSPLHFLIFKRRVGGCCCCCCCQTFLWRARRGAERIGDCCPVCNFGQQNFILYQLGGSVSVQQQFGH